MKFQSVLGIILSLTLSLSGVYVASPSIQAAAAEEQTVSQDAEPAGEEEPSAEMQEQDSAEADDEADQPSEAEALEEVDEADEEPANEEPADEETDYEETDYEETDEAVEETDAEDDDAAEEEAAGEDDANEGANAEADDAKGAIAEESADEDDDAGAVEAVSTASEENGTPLESDDSTEEACEPEAVEITPEEETGKDPALSAEYPNPSDVVVNFSKASYSVGVGQTTQLSYTVNANGASYDKIEFFSSDPSVATVSTDGVITGRHAGEATVICLADEVWGLDSSCVIKVLPINLSGAAVTGIANKTFTGNEIEQKPTVKCNGKTLVSDVDYTISYKNNVNAGKATVSIKGTGDYTGTITRTFTIKKAQSKLSNVTSRFTFPMSIANTWRKGIYNISGKYYGDKRPVTKVISIPKKARKYIKIAKNGKITIKKGLKYGKYKIKVRITVPGSANFKKKVVNKTIMITVKKNLKKYKSLKKLGVKGYDSKLDQSVNAAFDEMILTMKNTGYNYNKLTPYQKAHFITLYIGSRFSYNTGSYDAESMLRKGYGTCFAYSDLTYLMAKKAGLKNSWLTVPGKNVAHGNSFYGSQHRSVVTRIGKKYYELDSNRTNVFIQAARSGMGSFDTSPEQITKSYAMYLLGKAKKFKSITVK